MSKLSILISCMHQDDERIVSESNVQTDVVVINQCNNDHCYTSDFNNIQNDTCKLVWINTSQRGLSKSRNMAIRNATSELCLIADDDEWFEDDAHINITQAFQEYPKADIITFLVEGSHSFNKPYAQHATEVGYIKAMQTSSVQIAFRLNRVVEKAIAFDELMGSGSGHGGGEEIKFLFDSLHKGLKIQHVPVKIASLKKGSDSQWFKGYTKDFFIQRGWSTRRYLGTFMAVAYAWYYSVRKRHEYGHEMSMIKAVWYIHKGIFLNL